MSPFEYFRLDVNYDGHITISDVLSWFMWLFFLPGDMVVYFTLKHAESLATFLEMSEASYSNVGSGVMSFVFWFFLIASILSSDAKAQRHEG